MKHYIRRIREWLHLNEYKYELYEWIFDYEHKKAIIIGRKYSKGSCDIDVYRISYIDDNEPKWVLPGGIIGKVKGYKK